MKEFCIHGLFLAGLLLLPCAAADRRQATQSPQPGPPASTSSEQAAPAAIPVPLPAGIHLALKDGTFLLVREYKLQGDRVRYWSVERSAWEEIPAELVDWDATHKGEAADAARKKKIDQKLEDIAQEQRATEIMGIDASIEVAPNVYLPDDPGLYVVANKTVTSLSQDLAKSNMNKRRILLQVITPIPVVPTKHDIKLPGARAALRLPDGQPEFYFRTADQRDPAVALLRAQVHGDHRLLAEINVDIAGQAKTKDRKMLTEGWLVAKGVYRYTLEQKLEPGEYAFIENVPGRGMDLYVWDFGVDTPASNPKN